MTQTTETMMDKILTDLTPGETGILAATLDMVEGQGDDDAVFELNKVIVLEDITVIPGTYPPAVADLQERLAYHIVHVLKRVLPVRNPESVAIKQARDDAARMVAYEEFESWGQKELIHHILDMMGPKIVREFADETVELREEHIADNS